MEDALAGEWEPEGHQLRDHLPGGRVVGEEATVPGGADAGRETARGGPGSVPGRGAAGPAASGSLFRSPADHIAQGRGGQEQAQEEPQLEEEDGAGGAESPRGRPGVPQQGVLGGGGTRTQGGVVSADCRPEVTGRAAEGCEGCPAGGAQGAHAGAPLHPPAPWALTFLM